MAVYGGANIDIQAVSRARFRAADSNPSRSSITLGGVGRNIAENCARLGLSVQLVTVIGDDALSPILVDASAKLGIEIAHSLFVTHKATPRYICLLDSDGTLVGAASDMDALDNFTVAEFMKRTAPGDNADMIVLDANLPEPVIAAAAERWKEKPLFFEPVSVAKAGRAAGSLGRFSVIKPNVREAVLLAGAPLSPASSAGEDAPPAGEKPEISLAVRCAEVLRTRGVKEVFVSLGAKGLLYCSGEGRGIVKPLAMPVVNVSGAGDAACAGIIWACLSHPDSACGDTARAGNGAANGVSQHGNNTARKARYAVAAASLCASSPDTVSKEMCRDYLETLEKEVRHESIS